MNRLPACIFKVNEMGNKELYWSGDCSVKATVRALSILLDHFLKTSETAPGWNLTNVYR